MVRICSHPNHIPWEALPDTHPDSKEITLPDRDGSEKTTYQSIEDLIKGNRMSEFGRLLRFFTLTQIEEMLCTGPFQEFEIHPFGSSVCGFGSDISDLDMVIYPKALSDEDVTERNGIFLFQGRGLRLEERRENQKCIETLGLILDNYMPQVRNVMRIIRARIPIVKFNFVATDIPCDLSADVHCELDISGPRMAHLQYLISQYEDRIFGVVILLKHWLKNNGISQHMHNPGISSFQLLILIVHYLQDKAILPPLKYFLDPERGFRVKSPQSSEPKSPMNDESIEDLVREFFRYYATFPFEERGIDVYEGGPLRVKSDFGCIYARNPLEPERNVFHNITERELTKFVSALEMSVYNEDRDLIDIVQGLLVPDINEVKKRKKRRLLEVENLFKEQ